MVQIARTEADKPPVNARAVTGDGVAARKRAAEQSVGAARGPANWVGATAPDRFAAVEQQQAADESIESRDALVNWANEQTKHNIETMQALASTFDWSRVFQIQAEHIRVSMERSVKLAQCLVDARKTMMVWAAPFSQRQAGKTG